jgi:hypothetical protein
MTNLRVIGVLAGLTVSSLAQAYCPTSGGNTSYEYIDNVAINGDLRLSGDDGGYGNYTEVPIEPSARNLSIELTPGFPSSAYTEHWSVWIDVDGDGQFGASELLFSGSGASAVSGTIDLPANTAAGSTGLRVSMSFGNAATDPCASFTWGEVEDYTITVPQSGEGQTQTPWRTNAPNTVITDLDWHYAMGYHFLPQIDGQVTGLGGLFSGTKVVRLFDRTRGTLLAEATVTASNDWAYSRLNEPVQVTAGNEYTVAVYLAGSGGALHYSPPQDFPQLFKDILIDGTTYEYTGSDANARPTNSLTGIMYGVADIEFVPGEGGEPKPIDANCDKDVIAGLASQGELEVGPSGDMVPLCSGLILLSDRTDHTVKLIDIGNGSVSKSYGLSAKPGKLALDSTKAVLYVTLDSKSAIAKIDLATGTVTEIGINYPAIDVAVADDGNVFAIVQAGTAWWERPIEIIDPLLGQVVTVFEPSSQASGAQLLAFDAVNGYLFTGDTGGSPSSLTRYIYHNGGLTEDEYLGNAGSNGQDLAVSPDGWHLAFACGGGNGSGYTVFDFAPANFNALNGAWDTGAYPSSVDFNATSTLLAALNYDELLVFDVSSKVLLHSYKPGLSGCDYSDLEKVRFSRGGAIVYGFSNCGFDNDSGRLVWSIYQQ